MKMKKILAAVMAGVLCMALIGRGEIPEIGAPKENGRSKKGGTRVEENMGRKLKFRSVKALQEKVDAYFEECEKTGEPLTVTGLALALDTSRETLLNYQKRDGYGDVVRRAKMKIENAYEKRLIARGNGGDVFALKNFGWKDKSERAVEVTGDLSLEAKLKEMMGEKF